MAKFTFNDHLCIGCGNCMRACSKGLIDMAAGFPRMKEELSEKCSSCGQCVTYCPTDAAQQVLNLGELERAWQYDPEQTDTLQKFLRTRRSYRNFSPYPIGRTAIEKILATANYAPTARHRREIRWIIVEDVVKTRELGELIARWFDTDPGAAEVFPKREAIDKLLERHRNGLDPFMRGAPHIAFCVGPKGERWGEVDTGIALTYFNLACEAQNVGGCFCGYATYATASPEIREWLRLNDDEVVWCAMLFGNKTVPAIRIPNREPVDATFI